MTTPDAAREYLSRGWQPIPVPHRSKKPALKGWPDLRLTAADLARHFNGQPSNLGILLGEPSGGLVDADLDCAEALHLAPAFLPPTGSCFGRTSKRRSHWLYVVTTAVGTEKFIDSDGDTTFVPVFKLLLASNYRPLMREVGNSLYARMYERSSGITRHHVTTHHRPPLGLPLPVHVPTEDRLPRGERAGCPRGQRAERQCERTL